MPACICVSKFNCGVSPIILKSFGDRLSLGGMAPKAVAGSSDLRRDQIRTAVRHAKSNAKA